MATNPAVPPPQAPQPQPLMVELARDPGKDSIESGRDAIKLVITLATGLIALVPPLLSILKGPLALSVLLKVSISLALVSLVFGLLSLLGLAGTQLVNEYRLMHVARPWRLQLIFFAAAMFALVGFFFRNISDRPPIASPPSSVVTTSPPALLPVSFVVNFLPGASELTPDGVMAVLAIAASYRHQNPYFLIDGHADGIGSDSSNLILSRKRAEAAKSLLTDSGIPGSRIRTRAYGSSRPTASNTTEAGRQLNRRVQITMYFRI